MEYLKAPYRVATSPTAKKTYLGTFLFVYASLVLLGIAALAYPVFYYNYVPKKFVTFPIHLQYNAGLNPYGVVSLSSDLMVEQAYDVSVELTLPRSPTNLGRGNFMVALYAMKTAPDNPAFAFSAPGGDPYEHVTKDNVVFSSRRLALIPYEDPLVSTASRIFFLLYHIVFSRAAETITLTIPMAELVEFKGVLPLSFLVDVQAGQTLQVYSSSMTLVARLSGLRWFMYNHRILSFFIGATIFWLAEVVSMGLAWLVLGWVSSNRRRDVSKIKSEEHREPSTPGEDTPEHSTISAIKGEDDIKSERGTSVELPHHAGDADDEGDSGNDWKEASPSTASGFHSGKGGQVRRRLSWGGEGVAGRGQHWDE
ncbi:hypothetical protein F4861DRAFT_509993 [Xylaria intraflava]|nr:hypothetical protein F4861DRAFT_509993 [Xylaria intraflava]